MRGDIIYQIYGSHEERKEDMFMGAFTNIQEAKLEVENLKAKVMNGQN